MPQKKHPTIRVGSRFGRWKVLGAGDVVTGFRRWRCRCACGTERMVYQNALHTGTSRSCGCAPKRRSVLRHDLTNQVIGRWQVISRAPHRTLSVSGRPLKGKPTQWLCRCTCGTTKIVAGHNLTSGRSLSCGCYRSDVLSLNAVPKIAQP